jgi:hypothetical protein
MNYMVYLENGELRAYTAATPGEFETMRLSVSDKDILHYNGTSYPENVTPEIADILPVFIKTMTRQWKGSATFMQPKPTAVEPVVTEEPAAAPKPTKKTRKKKETQ